MINKTWKEFIEESDFTNWEWTVLPSTAWKVSAEVAIIPMNCSNIIDDPEFQILDEEAGIVDWGGGQVRITDYHESCDFYLIVRKGARDWQGWEVAFTQKEAEKEAEKLVP